MSTTLPTNDVIHVKLQFNDEYRRFNVPRVCKLSELIEKIKAILSLNKDFTLKYKDDENEWITISSDIELDTGMGFAKSNLLRLLVSVKTSVDSECGFGPKGDECGGGWRMRRMRRWRKWHGGCPEDEDEEGGDCKKKWKKWHDEDGGDCKKWRKYRGGCPKDGDEEGGDCKKKWKRHQEEGGDCKKWKKWRNEECGDGEHHGRGRWRKHGDEEEPSDGECGKKWRRRRERDNEKGEKKCRKGKWTEAERDEWLAKRGMKRDEWLAKKKEKRERKMAKRNEENEDDALSIKESDFISGDELLSLEQIKKEIETLKATVEKLREKVKAAKDGLSAIKNEIKEKRKAGSFEEVLALRGKLKNVKEEKFTLFTELKKNQRRIRVLTRLATSKGN